MSHAQDASGRRTLLSRHAILSTAQQFDRAGQTAATVEELKEASALAAFER